MPPAATVPLPRLVTTPPSSSAKLPEFDGRLERLGVDNGKDAQESFAGPEVIVANGGVVLLSGGVEYVDLGFFAVQDHSLPVRVGLRRLVVFDELTHRTSFIVGVYLQLLCAVA